MKLMDDWKMIKQGEGSLLDYVDKYRQLILQLPHLHELTRLHGFFSCLRYRIRIDVEKQNPRNLAEAMRLAERIGDLEFVNRSFRSWGFTSQYSLGRGQVTYSMMGQQMPTSRSSWGSSSVSTKPNTTVVHSGPNRS